MLQFTCCGATADFFKPNQVQLLRGILRGYERECLRVDSRNGQLAQTPHPVTLGSKLTHPCITTDYSEALLEFITPPTADLDLPLQQLRELHAFTAQQLQNLPQPEMMWAGSMPCILGSDAQIPLANYGTSHAARFKGVYRHGLGLRYGRHMQTIAGAHYNWSLPIAFWEALHTCCNNPLSPSLPLKDFISERYFGLIRNFLRFGWLVPYMFGASPAICGSFLQGRKSDLQPMVNADKTPTGALYGEYATSLRMSDLGYQNHAQNSLNVSFNSLQDYTQALESAIATPDPFYTEMGVQNQNGKTQTKTQGEQVEGMNWQQLNVNLLQIENEFYAGMRPKRVGKRGERPAKALQKYGVEYIEMRLFDLNPMLDIGIAPAQSDFVDALLLMCLFRSSPPITAREQAENDENKRRIVNRGRDPDLHLWMHNREQPMRPIAHGLLDDMLPFAKHLDNAHGTRRFVDAVENARQRIDAPELTPSAQVLQAMQAEGGYFTHVKNKAHEHHSTLLKHAVPPAVYRDFEQQAVDSLVEQHQIEQKEATEERSFADFVAAYYA